MKVFKYELRIQGPWDVELPTSARVLSVGVQFERVMLWCLVNPIVETMERRRFHVVGTGQWIPDDLIHELDFIGTVVTSGGSLVWHIFEHRQA